MSFRKFKADYLFTGRNMAPQGSVLICHDNGTVEAVVDAIAAGDNVEVMTGMLTPGFINTHCHLELSHMKSVIPPGTGLIAFLTRVIKERGFSQEFIIEAMKQAEEELYASGTVAVADICNTTDSIPVKSESKIHWRNFIEVIGFTRDKAEERLAYCDKVLERFREAWPLQTTKQLDESTVKGKHFGERTFTSSLTPHAPYSVSDKLFSLINDASSGQLITIHNQEGKAEDDLYRFKTGEAFTLYRELNIDASFFTASGKSSLSTFLPWLNKASKILLVHNTCTTEDDILFAQASKTQQRIFYAVCINANRYIASALPPLALLRKHHCVITIGTDSYASNWQLDMLSEIKSIQKAFSIPLAEIMRWATLNGAEALEIEGRFGSFDAGKQPGVVLVDHVVEGQVSEAAVSKRII